MARYARRLEANEAVRKAKDGVPEAEIVAAQQKARRDFGVDQTLARLFSIPDESQN